MAFCIDPVGGIEMSFLLTFTCLIVSGNCYSMKFNTNFTEIQYFRLGMEMYK